MIESVLNKKGASIRVKITVKSLISVGLVVLAIALPQIVHAISGSSGGIKWLPMYLPVLLGGCLLGVTWGVGIGIASPIISFIITSLAGNAMPALARLPFMVAELAVFAVVAGMFAKKIESNGFMAFPAVLIASLSGRAVFMLLAVIFQSITPFTPSVIWSQINSGFIGLIAQALLVPLIVMGLKFILDREKKDE